MTGQGQIWFLQGPIFLSKEPFTHCRVKHILYISKAKSQAKIGRNKASLSPFPGSPSGTQTEINDCVVQLSLPLKTNKTCFSLFG